MAGRDWSAPWEHVTAGKPALARAWAQVVTPVGTSRAEIELHLRRQLEELHDALLATPPDAAAAGRVGVALAERCAGDPAALGATITLLADRLLSELGLDEVTFLGPLHTLLGSLATAYARTLRSS